MVEWSLVQHKISWFLLVECKYSNSNHTTCLSVVRGLCQQAPTNKNIESVATLKKIRKVISFRGCRVVIMSSDPLPPAFSSGKHTLSIKKEKNDTKKWEKETKNIKKKKKNCSLYSKLNVQQEKQMLSNNCIHFSILEVIDQKLPKTGWKALKITK